jgi:hypothetical protein
MNKRNFSDSWMRLPRKSIKKRDYPGVSAPWRLYTPQYGEISLLSTGVYSAILAPSNLGASKC